MKYIKTLFILSVFLLLLSGSAMASTRGSDIDVVLLNYEPVPARPGNTIDAWFQVENTGNEASLPATLTFMDSYPFSVSLASDKEKMIPSIPARESFLVRTKIRIDKDAHEGENLLQINILEQGDEAGIDFEVPISIRGRTSALSVMSAHTTPSIIPPGSEGTVSITIENVGETQVSNLDVTLDLNLIPATPTSGSNSKTLGSLKSGDKHSFVFTLQASPDAPVQTYQLPVDLTYESEQGTEKSQEEVVGFVVGSEPELLVYLERCGLSKTQTQGDVIIKFVNRGLSEIKLLQMEVVESDNLKVASDSAVIYVGNIDEDDYESADITLKVDASTTELPIKLVYKDAFNQPYEETITLKLDLDAKSENGEKGGSSWVVWLIVIVVIVGGIWMWRRSKNKNKKRKK